MSNTTDRIVDALIRHKTPVLVATAVLTLFFGYFLTKIDVNNDPTRTVPKDLKARTDYQKLQSVFSSPRTVLLIAQFDNLPLQTKIDSIKAWAKQFESIDGIGNVVHIGSIQVPVSGGMFGITSDYLVSRRKKLGEDQVRQRIEETRALAGMLISEDESTFSMIMDVDESKNQVKVVSAVDRLQEEISRRGPAKIYVTGAPMYAYFIDQAMKRDFAVLLPSCLIVVFFLLYAVFRRFSYVFAALGIIAVALVWTFGMLGMSGMEFSVVTSIIPVILFPIGVATAIHVFRTFERICTGGTDDKRGAILATFRELMKPIFLSAITTFVGFASFSFSRVTWTRVFGIFTSIGVALALLLSIILLPIFLAIKQTGQKNQAEERTQRKALTRLWRMYERFIFSPYRWAVLVLAIIVIGVLGFIRVRVEGNPIAMFPPKSDVRRSDAIIEKHLGGTRFLFILLEHKSEPLLKEERWRRVEHIVQYAEGMDMVGSATSLLPLINRVSMMLSDTTISDPALSMLLKGKGLLGKKFESYLRNWVTPERQKTKIALVCKNVVGTRFMELSRQLEEHIRTQYPEFNVLVAGPPVLNDAMTYVLIDTQISSLAIAFVSVFLVLCLLFRSIKVGAFAIVPIMLSTVFVYALMGFFGIAINSVTVIIVNTCIGMGIDYAIHFTAGYLYLRNDYATRRAALSATGRIKGSVILFNTFVVGIGFLVLAFSSFPPIRDLGIFVFVSMVASSTFSLLFLPVFFRLFGVGARDEQTPATS